MIQENPHILSKRKVYLSIFVPFSVILILGIYGVAIFGCLVSFDNIIHAIILIVCLLPLPAIGIYILYSKVWKLSNNRIVFFENDLLIEDHDLLIPWYDVRSITLSSRYKYDYSYNHILLIIKTKNDQKYTKKILTKNSKYPEFGLTVADLLGYKCTKEEAFDLFKSRHLKITIFD